MIQRSPNHTRGRTPWIFSSSGRVSVACSNSAIRVSRHSSLPQKNGEFAATATCTPAIACAAFQYARERLGLDLLVELDARARGLGRDRVGVGREALDAGDRDLEVLAARGEDLLVQQRVPRVRAERLGAQMLGADRRAGSR